jgi:hypothetical protein
MRNHLASALSPDPASTTRSADRVLLDGFWRSSPEGASATVVHLALVQQKKTKPPRG